MIIEYTKLMAVAVKGALGLWLHVMQCLDTSFVQNGPPPNVSVCHVSAAPCRSH